MAAVNNENTRHFFYCCLIFLFLKTYKHIYLMLKSILIWEWKCIFQRTTNWEENGFLLIHSLYSLCWKDTIFLLTVFIKLTECHNCCLVNSTQHMIYCMKNFQELVCVHINQTGPKVCFYEVVVKGQKAIFANSLHVKLG